SIREAAIEGGRMRFRPILMTSFAFIAGLLPLVVATGPGAIGNRTIGTTAVGGMLVGTLLGVLVLPRLYYIFRNMSDGRCLIKDQVDQPLSEELCEMDTSHTSDGRSSDGSSPDDSIASLDSVGHP